MQEERGAPKECFQKKIKVREINLSLGDKKKGNLNSEILKEAIEVQDEGAYMKQAVDCYNILRISLKDRSLHQGDQMKEKTAAWDTFIRGGSETS